MDKSFEKRVVRTKFDIYVLINYSFTLLLHLLTKYLMLICLIENSRHDMAEIFSKIAVDRAPISKRTESSCTPPLVKMWLTYNLI